MRLNALSRWGLVCVFALGACGDTDKSGSNDPVVIVDENNVTGPVNNTSATNNTTPNNTAPNNTAPNNTAPSVSCTPVVQKVDGTGGCRLTLVSPANCEDVDFSAGPVEFAYTTETSFCEGPHKFLLAGHPETTWQSDNGFVLDLTSTDGNFVTLSANGSSYSMTRNIGGVVRIAQADLAGITTTTGQYHWGVTGFYALDNGGSASGTQTFTIRGQ